MKSMTIERVLLENPKPVYMLSGRDWPQFKTALANVAQGWGFKDWIYTIVEGGDVWRAVKEAGHLRGQPSVAADEAGDGDFSLTQSEQHPTTDLTSQKEKGSSEEYKKPVVSIHSTSSSSSGTDPTTTTASAATYTFASEPGSSKEGILDPELRRLAMVSEGDEYFFGVTTRFLNLIDGNFEDSNKLPVRQKFWGWFEQCLRGPGAVPGPYHYLTTQVVRLDVAALYKKIAKIVDKPTIISHSETLNRVFSLEYRTGQDLFMYLGQLRSAVKAVHDRNREMPQHCEVKIPDAIIRAKIIQALGKNPMYKAFLDNLLTKETEDWATMTLEGLYRQLETVTTNHRDLNLLQHGGASDDFTLANQVRVHEKPKYGRRPGRVDPPTSPQRTSTYHAQNKPTDKSVHVNYSGTATVSTSGPFKKFEAPKKRLDNVANVPTKNDVSKKQDSCLKCGGAHRTKECSFSGECHWCGKKGHKEFYCLSKKKGNPKVTATKAVVEDGAELIGRMIDEEYDQGMPLLDPWYFWEEEKVVDDGQIVSSIPSAQVIKVEDNLQANITLCDRDNVKTSEKPGWKKEVFFADTGANRPITPDISAANTFLPARLQVGTAKGGQKMTSDGIGTMVLYTPSGKLFPGFDNTVFIKEAVDKLASVGDICDNGIVCVFDCDGLKTYDKSTFKMDNQNEPITSDGRDRRTRLYHLTLYRKQLDNMPQPQTIKQLRQTHGAMVPYARAVITNARRALDNIVQGVPTKKEYDLVSKIAKTYVKDDLPVVERWHAKLGDVGMKTLKKALPDLVVPKKHRCESCIMGKMHSLGHKSNAKNDRVKYAPGECLHVDLGGPYCPSHSGCKYSMLILDMGSRFLWARGLVAKSDFLGPLKDVIADCQAASGRRLRFLQTDGDGIFRSESLKQYLQSISVRHLWSAPYDSDTNPFIERERRTVLEGTATSLIRSGAPSVFWGEAEGHKVFTINVLPTLEQKDNVSSDRGGQKDVSSDEMEQFGTEDNVQTISDNLTEANQAYKSVVVPSQKQKDNVPSSGGGVDNVNGAKIGVTPKIYLSRKNVLEGNQRKFNLDHLMAFGTACICHIPKERRLEAKTPVQKKSFKGVIVGYAENGSMEAYRVWDLEDRKFRLMSYAFTVAMEGYYPFKDRSKWLSEWEKVPVSFQPTLVSALNEDEWTMYRFGEEESDSVVKFLSKEGEMEKLKDNLGQSKDNREQSQQVVEVESELDEKHLEKEKNDNFTDVYPNTDFFISEKNSDKKFPDETMSDRRRSTRNIVPSEKYLSNLAQRSPGSTFSYANSAILEKPVHIPPPKTLKEAKESVWWSGYKEAADKEMKGHEENKTWVYVKKSEIPGGTNVLRPKMVFDDKRGPDGRLLRFKARLVAMGFTQREGIDFHDTFASVMKSKSFRILLQIWNSHPTHTMKHWDVTMAFVKAPLTETLYMHQPEGWVCKGKEEYVLRLQKALYGLKQAAREWQQYLKRIMISIGGVVHPKDDAVFLFREGQSFCFIGTHVDDLFPVCNVSGECLRDRVWRKMKETLEINDLGTVSWALKTTISRTLSNARNIVQTLTISQETYCRSLLSECGWGGSKGCETPAIESGPEAEITDSDLQANDEEKREVEKLPFQQRIGALWWLAQISRPDIFLATHRVSKHQHKPSKKLWRWVERIFKYLARYPHLGLVYHAPTEETLLFKAYVDAAFATEENSASRTGWCFYFLGAPVAWASENPTRVMSSSTEAECRGVVQVGKENVWMREFVDVLGLYNVSTPTRVYEDNSSVIHLSKGQSGKRSKHFGIEWDLSRDMIEKKEMELIHVATEEQAADLLTKPLGNTKFHKFRSILMGLTETETRTQYVEVCVYTTVVSGQMSSAEDDSEENLEEGDNAPGSLNIIDEPQDNVPSSRDNVPTTRDNVSWPRDNVSSSRDNVSSHQDNVPNSRDNVSSPRDNVSSVRNNVSSTKDNVPAVPENVPKQLSSKGVFIDPESTESELSDEPVILLSDSDEESCYSVKPNRRRERVEEEKNPRFALQNMLNRAVMKQEDKTMKHEKEFIEMLRSKDKDKVYVLHFRVKGKNQYHSLLCNRAGLGRCSGSIEEHSEQVPSLQTCPVCRHCGRDTLKLRDLLFYADLAFGRPPFGVTPEQVKQPEVVEKRKRSEREYVKRQEHGQTSISIKTVNERKEVKSSDSSAEEMNTTVVRQHTMRKKQAKPESLQKTEIMKQRRPTRAKKADNVTAARNNVSMSKDNVSMSKDNVSVVKDNVSMSKDNVSVAKDNVPGPKVNVRSRAPAKDNVDSTVTVSTTAPRTRWKRNIPAWELTKEIATEEQIAEMLQVDILIGKDMKMVSVYNHWYDLIIRGRKMYKHFSKEVKTGMLMGLKCIFNDKRQNRVGAFVILGEREDNEISKQDPGRSNKYCYSYPIKILVKLSAENSFKTTQTYRGGPQDIVDKVDIGQATLALRRTISAPGFPNTCRPDLFDPDVVALRKFHRDLAGDGMNRRKYNLPYQPCSEYVESKQKQGREPKIVYDIRGAGVWHTMGRKSYVRSTIRRSTTSKEVEKLFPGLHETIKQIMGIKDFIRPDDMQFVKSSAYDADQYIFGQLHADFVESDLMRDAMVYGYAPISYMVGVHHGSRIMEYSHQAKGNDWVDTMDVRDYNKPIYLAGETLSMIMYRPNWVYGEASPVGGHDNVILKGRVAVTRDWQFNGSKPHLCGSASNGPFLVNYGIWDDEQTDKSEEVEEKMETFDLDKQSETAGVVVVPDGTSHYL
jgi:hypothetical protein